MEDTPGESKDKIARKIDELILIFARERSFTVEII